MTKCAITYREGGAGSAARCGVIFIASIAWVAGQPAAAESPPTLVAPSAALSSGRSPGHGWMAVPRSRGGLTAKDIGLVINLNDPYSVEVGEFYLRARGLAASQVLRVALPVRPALSPQEFDALKVAVDERFGSRTQALALAWVQPYAVNCNSVTAALTLGYDGDLCRQTCQPSKLSPYFNARTTRPYDDLRLRPAMLLAAKDVGSAKRLIERGVRADKTLARRGAPPVHAYFVATGDRARSARVRLFPPPGALRGVGIVVHVEAAPLMHDSGPVLLYQTGATRVKAIGDLDWVPGALADHLTSFGGQLDGRGGQMDVLEWITAGATASYGTVSEPCSHPEKFPHPQILLLHYAQGITAIEAYWKSVAWPQQGVFVGEPLAAPFRK